MTEVKILKTHSLFINRVSFKNQVSVTGFSVNCGQNYTLQSEHSINFSQILNISTIDCINTDHQVIDSQVIVNFYGFQINHISHIGSIIFDMRVEKIVKPNGKNCQQNIDELRKKQFTNGNGFIQYKFIGLNSTNISREQMNKYLGNKDKIILMNSGQKQRQSFDEFMKIISEKDQIIEYLETKTKDLIQEKKKLNKIINKKQIQVQKYSKQKFITLNVKFHQKSLQQIQHFPSQISRENIQRQYIQNIQSQIKTGSKLDSKKESRNDRHANIFRNRIPNNSMVYHESQPNLESLQSQSAFYSPRKNSVKNSPRKNSKLHSTQKNDLLQQKDQKMIKFEDQEQQQLEKNILNELKNQKIKLIKQLQIQSKEMGILRRKLQNKEKKIENLSELNNNIRENLRNHLEKNSINVQGNFEEVKFQNEHLNEENDLLKSEIKNLEEQLALKIENSYHQNQQNEELKNLQYINQKKQNKYKIDINIEQNSSKVRIKIYQQITMNKSVKENLRNKLIEKEKQMIRLKDIEFNYQLCKKNIQRLQMSNGKFEVYWNKIKAQTMKLESLLQNEPKNTNDENINTKNNMIYKRNLQQRIDTMEQKLCQFQKEYYGQILSSLEQQKKDILDSYSIKINQKNQNSLNSDINNKSKQILQEEMKREIDAIELKIQKIKESLLNNFVRNDLVIQDKIKIMDQKMGVILQEIHSLSDDKKSGKMSKTVINQINSNLNQRQNKVQKSQFSGLKPLNDQQNLFVQETSNYNNYRESMIGQMNKNKELYTKSFDELKKHNRELLKQKSQLQLEIHNYKFKENKLVSKHQQRQDNLQKMAKQTENQHHMIQEKQNKAIEQMSNKYEQVELQNQQYHKSMVNLIEQLKNVSNQLEKEIAYNEKQQLQNQKLYQRTIRYEQAQSILIKQVRQIKQKANYNEENFSRLFEQRNQQFLKIEKIKSTEIQKLKSIIFQLEEQIEGQVLENINLTIEKQKKNTENTVLLEKINQLQEFIALNNENNENKNIQLLEKIQQISVHNEILEKNLVQIAEQIRSKEIEIEEYNCQNRSLKLQNDSLLNLKQDLLQLQKNHSKQKQELQQIISNQTNEIKKIESNYIAIEENVKKVINQNQEINHKNKQLSSEIQQLNINFSNSQIHLKRILYEKESLQAQIKNYEMKKNNQTTTNDILIKRLNKIEDQISGIKNNDQISQKQIKSKRMSLKKNKLDISQLKSSISNKQIYDRKSKDYQHFLKPQSINSGDKNSVIDIDIDISKYNSSKSLNIHKNIQKEKESQINFNYEQIQDSIQIQSKEELMKIIEKKNQKSILKDDNNSFQNSSQFESLEIKNQIKNSFQDNMKQQIRRLKEQIQAFKKENKSLANEIGKKNQKISQLLIELENFKSQKDSNQLRKSFKVEQSRKISEEINKFKVDSIHGSIDKQKFDEAQLYIQELKFEVDNLTKELKEENSNNKKLLEATDELLDDRDCFHQKYQQMKNLLKQSKQNHQEELAVMQSKIDNFILETLQKQNQMTKTVTNLAIIKQENENNLLKIIQLSQNNQKKITQIIKINNEKKKMKEQYCKYEQQAETQILQLKQSIDKLKNSIQLKDQELLLLGDNYCSLEQKLIQTEKIISESSDQQQKMQWHLSQFKKKYENLNHVINEKQKKQSDLSKKMKEIEVEKTKLEQSLSTIHKNSVMTMKKQTIQSQIQIKQKKFCQNQIQDKDKQINNLKNQLGLYNQKTLELQNVNRQLSYELDKVEKELKDIMKAYEMEFCNLQNNQNAMMRIKQQSEKQLKEKNEQIRQIMKLYKQKDQIITQQEQQLKNFKKAYQNYKTSKQTQLNQKNIQIQLTKDQYEKYKKSYEIAEEKFVLKECKFIQEQEKSQIKIKSMKQKLLKYQQNIQQLQKEFQEYNKKPTQEQFQQLYFTNEQYRLKIKELEENEEQSNINRENMMYLEFRKYKIFKEGQLQDLENQMEKYGNKINQLQQLNYYMKKDLQKCRVELKIMLSNKEQLQQENQDLLDDIESIKSELQFYKARKLEDLSKLLNETDD